MESFGHHLGADENIGFSGAELSDGPVIASLVPGSVGVDPQSSDLGKKRVKGIFDMLGADAAEFEGIAASARGALVRRGGNEIAAKVAKERLVVVMVGEGKVAMGAFHRFLALHAKLHGVITPPVEEEDRLFPL